MTKYAQIFDTACGALRKSYKQSKFSPVDEQDVVSFLYHACLQKLKDKDARRIHVWQRGIDITFGRPHANQDSDASKIRVIAEVKMKRSTRPWKKRLKSYYRQIKRLRDFQRKFGIREPRLVVFDAIGGNDPAEVKWVKGILSKYGIKLCLIGKNYTIRDE